MSHFYNIEGSGKNILTKLLPNTECSENILKASVSYPHINVIKYLTLTYIYII